MLGAARGLGSCMQLLLKLMLQLLHHPGDRQMRNCVWWSTVLLVCGLIGLTNAGAKYDANHLFAAGRDVKHRPARASATMVHASHLAAFEPC